MALFKVSSFFTIPVAGLKIGSTLYFFDTSASQYGYSKYLYGVQLAGVSIQ